MAAKLLHSLHLCLERAFPEQRLFLRSDSDTRYVRLSPATQVVALTGSAMLIGWTIVASAILLMDSLGAGNLREQALQDKKAYEERLNALSEERDLRAEEARAAHERFSLALAEVSAMQGRLLAAEERRKELETGMTALRGTLQTAIDERDAQADEAAELASQLAAEATESSTETRRLAELQSTVDRLSDLLTRTATLRDGFAGQTQLAMTQIEDMEFERQLVEDRNDRIFQQLEDAVAMSMEPLDDMFSEAGLPADSILDSLSQAYSGQGGPLMPLRMSTKSEEPDPDSLRANEILARLDRMNLYRIALEKTPFSFPVDGHYRYTSGYGMRWGRMHKGSDFAGKTGTPILATADGVVVHAGWLSGYGRLVKIKHEFGIETRYAHLNKIHVKVGDTVSRGDRIGDMGNTGRSTGTHLHYEVLLDGNPTNPMKFIKAARDVF